MQLMDKTAIQLNKKINIGENEQINYNSEDSLYNPETNIKLGTYYFSTLLKKYRRYWFSPCSI